jgi:hypothetical protein
MSESLAMVEQQQIINVAESALSIDQIVKQRELITSCMARAMKENQHYGKVPGCGDKPTLLQPGAQLLAHLFRLRPEYEILDVDLPNGHKRFRVTCRLFFIGSHPEIKIAEGVGESSSMESKHRFRNAAAIITPTGDPVPSTYWDIKNKNGPDAAKQWAAKTYEGKNISTKKIDGAWQFVIVEGGSDEKIENANPADVFNTVLKIAKKRAFVDATITATASSDFFTQDLEDIRDNLEAVTTKAESLATGTATEEKKANAATITNWREVECTFGKKNGPLRGKKLGDLNPSNLKYLAEMFLVEGKNIADKDHKMVAALAIWKAEASGAHSDDLPKFNGKKHEELYERLVWEKIDPVVFIDSMKKAGLLPETAKNFANMSDETAAKFLPEFDDTILPLLKKAA